MRNILSPLPDASKSEIFTSLLNRPGLRIERIVSAGQTTPGDEIYDQPHDEWILLLAGGARLWLEDQGDVTLTMGDCLFLPAHCRHRVIWTQAEPPTVWLAIHISQD